MAEVVLEEIGKTYPGDIQAVADLNLRIADGELLVLVGPSGCGKTTTLRLLAGLEVPTRGIIRMAGQVVNAVPPHRRNLALVFQRPALYPHLTVRQNLVFGLELSGARPKPAERARRVEQAAELLQLSGLLERLPTELSGGQQQRVALGALVRQPGLLLLDEPLSNLDARLRLEMRRELHLLQRQIRATMIYVTHDQEEGLALGDRVAVLEQGSLRQVDVPAILYARPAHRSVAGFFGCPPMNLLDGRLEERQGRLVLAGKQGDWLLPTGREEQWRPFVGPSITVGIRPEQMWLTPGKPATSQAVKAAASGIGREVGKPTIPPRDQAGQEAVVEVVERLGPDSRVTLRREEWRVTVRVPGSISLGEQTRAAVSWDPNQAFLFDRDTGRVLVPGRAEEGSNG